MARLRETTRQHRRRPHRYRLVARRRDRRDRGSRGSGTTKQPVDRDVHLHLASAGDVARRRARAPDQVRALETRGGTQGSRVRLPPRVDDPGSSFRAQLSKCRRTSAACSGVSSQRAYGTLCQPWSRSHWRIDLALTPSSADRSFGVMDSSISRRVVDLRRNESRLIPASPRWQSSVSLALRACVEVAVEIDLRSE
jgi:hypothetical protein